MINYIQDTIIRSRLTLTYRMHIDGKPVDEKLPFRLLVLGDFSGLSIDERKPLAQRQVIKIPKGVRFEDAFADAGLGVAVRFDEKVAADGSVDPGGNASSALKPLISWVQGDFSGSVSGKVDFDTDPAAKTMKVKGTLTLEGKRWAKGVDKCNGLGDFTGKIPLEADIDISTAVDSPGKLKDAPPALTQDLTAISIPLATRITGDLAGDVSDTVSGKFTGKIETVDGQPTIVGVVTGKAWVKIALPIRNLDSFSPDTLGQYVPEIRRLRLVESLMLELRSTILTTPALKKAMMGLLLQPAKLTQLRDDLKARYPYLAITLPPAVAPAASLMAAPSADATALAATLFASGSPATAPKDLVLVEADTGALPTAPRALKLQDRNVEVLDPERFLNSLGAFFANLDDADLAAIGTITKLMDKVAVLTTAIEGAVNGRLTNVLDSEPFRTLERNWRGLAELCDEVSDDLVEIDVLDVRKDELQADLVDHDVDIMTSAFFKKLYHDEYDRYGGKPYGVMIGLYAFDGTKSDDLAWIQTMSKVANLAHCPFIAAAKPEFFGVTTMAEVEAIADLDKVMSHPRYGKWEAFRETDGAGYIGLTLPGYLLREPWGAVNDEPGNRLVKYKELETFDAEKLAAASQDTSGAPIQDALKDAFKVRERDEYRYLWGNPAILFARNLVRSFQLTGWCQRIRGQRGGGLIEGLTVHAIERKGRTEVQPPVEMSIPDFRELQFANHGFIPLIWRKDSSDATFFSARSAKKAIEFQNEIDTQNADLVCNLAYTFSITRIAHYIKLMARPYIGTSADANYLETMIETWLKGYVTTTVNPDDLTLQRYPFKAISVSVKNKPGPLGWYTSIVSIMPHVQFEGMDVELRLEAALGGAK